MCIQYTVCNMYVFYFYKSIRTCNQDHPQTYLFDHGSDHLLRRRPKSQCVSYTFDVDDDKITSRAFFGDKFINQAGKVFFCTSTLCIFRWSCFRFVKAPCQLSHFLHLGGSFDELGCEMWAVWRQDLKTSVSTLYLKGDLIRGPKQHERSDECCSPSNICW